MGDIMTVPNPCSRLGSLDVLLETCSKFVEVKAIFSPCILEGLRGITEDVRVLILSKAEHFIGIFAGNAILGVGNGTWKGNLMTEAGREVVKIMVPPSLHQMLASTNTTHVHAYKNK